MHFCLFFWSHAVRSQRPGSLTRRKGVQLPRLVSVDCLSLEPRPHTHHSHPLTPAHTPTHTSPTPHNLSHTHTHTLSCTLTNMPLTQGRCVGDGDALGEKNPTLPVAWESKEVMFWRPPSQTSMWQHAPKYSMSISTYLTSYCPFPE